MNYTIDEFLDYAFLMEQKKDLKEHFLQYDFLVEKKIAVLCGSTFGEIKNILEIFLLSYGIKPVFWEGEYNRFYEEACFDNPSLKEFNPEIIILHTTHRNLLSNMNETTGQMLYEDKNRLSEIWDRLKEHYDCVVIQNNFEYFPYRMIGNSARTFQDGNVHYVDEINAFVSAQVKERQNFYVNDIHYLSSYLGLKCWVDDRMWNLYKYPMSMTATPYYAKSIANIIKSICGKNKKLLVTDLDNTLWGGIIGEVGVDNIKLGKETPQGETFEILHRYLKFISQHGAVLGISSKNEFSIGISGIQSQKSYLKKDDFSSVKINWNNKSENIREILNELNLLEDAVVFIDDDSVECDSVQTLLPGVDVLQANKTGNLLKTLEASAFFEMTGFTEEDQQRGRYYHEEAQRKESKQQYVDYNEYLKSLKMICNVSRIKERNIERVTQLWNKTNQFNFLTVRYTGDEMRAICNKESMETFVLELDDKFGSSGIVSVGIARNESQDVYIEGWVMSCRVFERGLEFVMLKQFCDLCKSGQAKVLHGYYRKTDKNIKIKNFFEQMGFQRGEYSQEKDAEEWICNNIDELLSKCEKNPIEIIYNFNEENEK